MLIDVSYFTAGPRQILNATLGKGTTRENAVIEQYIAQCQEEFLCRAVGDEAAETLQAYLESLDSDPEADIVPSLETVCKKLRKAFADFVFFRILGDAGQPATVTGVVRLKCANEYVEPIVRQVGAWNRMSNQMNLFAEWVDNGECPLQGVAVEDYLLEPINRFNL